MRVSDLGLDYSAGPGIEPKANTHHVKPPGHGNGIEVNLALVYQLLIIPVLNLLLCLVVTLAFCSIVSVLSCVTDCRWFCMLIVAVGLHCYYYTQTANK